MYLKQQIVYASCDQQRNCDFVLYRAPDSEVESIGDLDYIDKLWNGKVESDMLKAHEIIENKLNDVSYDGYQ